MASTQQFQHESIQDRDSIIRYLRAITDGLDKGHLELGAEGEQLVLDPRGLIALEIKAKRKSGRVRLGLKFEWRENGENGDGAALRITAE
jgi:amphi-Trp domain-containing protein